MTPTEFAAATRARSGADKSDIFTEGDWLIYRFTFYSGSWAELKYPAFLRYDETTVNQAVNTVFSTLRATR